MGAIASRLYTHIQTKDEQVWFDQWLIGFWKAYAFVDQSPIQSAHQVVTQAREHWQQAHQQFYPVHRLRNATTPAQTMQAAFRMALFQHRLSVLLDLN